MPKSITATSARQNFFQVLETAGKPGMSITITREGNPSVVLMSADEFEGWQETLEILSDPTLLRAIKTGLVEKGSVSLADLTMPRSARSRAVRRSPAAKRRKAVS
jgi:antitoxin YefM